MRCFDLREACGDIVRATHDLPGIGGYKIGLTLALGFGLKAVVEMIRRQTEKPIIYDHQKAGTDIPGLGSEFARIVSSSGVNAVILFPFGGAATERAWIADCQEEDLTVLVGGHMTQPEFLASEGGFVAEDAPGLIYITAAVNGYQLRRSGQ
ncbi:hypothetical protein ACFL11_01025 [Patescibacteria group bacterium]